MIRNAKYSTNNRQYSDDRIITFKHDLQYQTKTIYHIVHNTKELKTQLKIDNYLINTIYFTSNIHQPCHDYNFQKFWKNNDYDIKGLKHFINTLCSDNNTLYTVIISGVSTHDIFNMVNNEKPNIQIITDIYANKNICDTIHNKIKIIDSNMTNLIGYKTQLKNEINIFSKGTIGFNNYITYEYIGFNNTKTIHLSHILPHMFKENNINNQSLAIIDYVDNNIEKIDKYSEYFIKILLHTIYYIKYVKSTSYFLSSLQLQLDYIKQLQLKKILNDADPSDELFITYLKCSDTYEKICTDKIYKENILKIKNREKNIIVEPLKNKNMIEKSLDFYTSKITLENWQELTEENKCFGILVNIKCPKMTKIGITSTNIYVNNYTNTLITSDLIISGQKIFFEKFFTLDNGKYGQNLLMGNAIGQGNGILPVYINNTHWSIAKLYVEECISLTLSQNCYSFNAIMLDVYYEVLMTIIINMTKNMLTYIDFTTFINIYITIMEIEKIYDIPINYSSNKCNFINHTNINKLLINHLMHNDKEINDFFANIYEENVRRNIYDFNKGKIKLFNNYQKNKRELLSQISSDNINGVYKLYKIKNQIVTIVESFLDNNGIINEHLYDVFKSSLTQINDYNYLQDIVSINNDFINGDDTDNSDIIIIDNLLLQSFITKNNKKRKKSFENHYKDIINTPKDVIAHNNNVILQKIAVN